MNKYIIKNELNKVGNTAHLESKGWISMPFKCVINRTFSRQKSDFEQEITEIGRVKSDYYMFYGPFDHNINVLGDDALLVSDGKRYQFKRKESFTVGDEVLYYFAVIRLVRE